MGSIELSNTFILLEDKINWDFDEGLKLWLGSF
jgi:hypothetical protein